MTSRFHMAAVIHDLIFYESKGRTLPAQLPSYTLLQHPSSSPTTLSKPLVSVFLLALIHVLHQYLHLHHAENFIGIELKNSSHVRRIILGAAALCGMHVVVYVAPIPFCVECLLMTF